MAGAEAVIASLIAITMGKMALTAATQDRHIQASVAYAKENASWEDRTSAARTGLDSVTDSSPNQVKSVIFHKAPHGEWLETRSAFDGRYKILEEAAKNNIESLFSEVRAIWGT
jgi:hypothetical protein